MTSLEKSFNRSSSLKKHQLIHAGVKPFHCEQCNMSFTLPSYLKTHQRVHNGEKPFHCSHCDKNFKHSKSLKKHQRTVVHFILTQASNSSP